MTMKITAISISKNQYGDDKDKYTANVAINGEYDFQPSIKITIDPEQLEPIVQIIQQIVAHNMAESAKAFADDVANSLNPPIEHEKLEAPVPASGDDVPF